MAMTILTAKDQPRCTPMPPLGAATSVTFESLPVSLLTEVVSVPAGVVAVPLPVLVDPPMVVVFVLVVQDGATPLRQLSANFRHSVDPSLDSVAQSPVQPEYSSTLSRAAVQTGARRNVVLMGLRIVRMSGLPTLPVRPQMLARPGTVKDFNWWQGG
jgi:hypothetical protein